MSGLQQIGVQAIFDVTQFTRGVAQYVAGLNRANFATVQAAVNMNTLGASARANAQRIVQLATTIAALRNVMQNQATQNAQLVAQLNALGAALGNAGAAAGRAGQSVRGAGQQAARSSTDWGGLASRVLILGGVFSHFAGRILGNLSERFNEAAGFVVGAVADYERLGFAIEALTRRERGQIQASETLRDRVSELSVSASELLPWITRLALESPFNEADVAQAFKTAQVYNFLSSEAQVLVTVLTDFAAATGKTGDDLERVALALGQMRSAGRVLGTELRQLSEAGINTTQILDSMGFSLKDVRDGAVGANDFIRTLVRTLAVDFEGAAKRQTDTLAGLASKLQDVMTIGARDLFGPMLKAIQPDLITFVNTLQSFLPVIKDIGTALGYLTGQLFKVSYGAERGEIAISGFSEGAKTLMKVLASIGISIATFIVSIGAIGVLIALIGALTNPILGVIALVGGLATAMAGAAGAITFFWEDLAEDVNETLDSWGTNMYEYGYNLIYQFAAGMAGAIGAILDVLTNIATAIAIWLSPGSPPRILPDIDKWGTATINEWLRGWLKGDFSLLEDIADPIEGLLRSMVGLGVDQIDVVPMIIAMRDAITGAVDEFVQLGAVSEDTFRRIFNQLGATDPVLQAYVRSMIALEIADKKVSAAQEELNAITERYQKLLEPIDDELQAIEDERQRFINNTRRADLQAILQDPFAPQEAKRLAALELREIALKEERMAIINNQSAEEEAAKEKLRLAQEERALVLEQMEAQKAQIALMTENNRLLQEQMRLLERLAKAKAGGEQDPTPPPFEPIDFGLGGAGPTPLPFTGLIDDLKKKIDAILLLFAPLTDKWEGFKTAAINAWEEIKRVLNIDAFFKTLETGDWHGAGLILGAGIGRLFISAVGFAATYGPAAQLAVHLLAIEIGKALLKIDSLFRGIGEGIALGIFIGLADSVTGGRGVEVLTRFNTNVATHLAMPGQWVQAGLDIIGGVMRGIGQGVIDAAAGIAQNVERFVEEFKINFGTHSPSTVFAEIGLDLVTGLYQGIANAWVQLLVDVGLRLDELKLSFTTKVTEVIDWIGAPERRAEALTAINNVVLGLIDGANSSENARRIRQGFINFVQGAIDAVLWLLGEHSPSKVFMEIGENTMLGMAIGVYRTGDLVGDAMVSAVTDAFGRVSSLSPPGIDPIWFGQPPLAGPPYNTNPPIPFPNQLLKFVNGRLVSPLMNSLMGGQTDPAEFLTGRRKHPGPGGGPTPMPLPIMNTHRTRHAQFLGPPSGAGGPSGPLAQFGDTYISNGMDEAVFRAKMKRTISNSIRGLG